jgi:hypothetical protein
LQGADRGAVEEELRKQGAKMVQVKQICKAMESLVRQEKTPVACTAMSFESPMAVYFGDSHPDLLSIFSEKSAPNHMKDSDNLRFPCESPHLMRKSPLCRSDGASFFDGGADKDNRIAHDVVLPYKSPMSAFFDGDQEFDEFFGSPSSEDTCTPSPPPLHLLEPSSSVPSAGMTSLGPCSEELLPCFNIMPLVPPGVLRSSKEAPQCPASAINSALHKGQTTKQNRVSFAGDKNEKAALQLVELIELPSESNVSSHLQHVWQLSQDPQGTFEVQKAIDECSNDDQRIALANELRGHVFEATRCPHANHVLRKVITTLPSCASDFIILELINHGKEGVIETAKHRYGCRILEGLLRQCTEGQLGGMVGYLLADPSLYTHMYGNFVMQRLLEQPHSCTNFRLRQCLHDHLAVVATSFYGSAVLRKALLHCDDIERLRLARSITSTRGLLAAIDRHRHGKETVDVVLGTLQGVEKQMAQNQLAAPPLKIPRSMRSH